MAERAVQHVFDCLIAVGERGDDGRVLAAGFGDEMHRRLFAEHFGGGFGAAGEDDGVDAGVRNESCADGAAAAGGKLQGRFRHARTPEALAQMVGDQHRVGRRFEDHRVAGGERGDAAAGNRERKVPG